MQNNTIEGFRPQEPGQAEQGPNRPKGFFREFGKRVRRLIQREFAVASPEARSAADQLRTSLAQTRESNPHRDPSAVREMTTTADRVDLGHPTGGQIVEGTVSGIEYHIPSPRNHSEALPGGTSVQEGREQYGRHDSGITRESETKGKRYASHVRMQGEVLADQSDVIGSEDWYRAQEAAPEAYNPHDASIGSETWHKAQEETPAVNPHEVSLGADRWARGDEAKAIVQEQQSRLQEQAARSTTEKEESSGDDLWAAREARRQRLLRMEKSVRPGEYTPDVIGAEPNNENGPGQKVA